MEVVSGKVSSVAILKHSRVPADFVLENLLSCEFVDDIAENFSLNPEDIRKVRPTLQSISQLETLSSHATTLSFRSGAEESASLQAPYSQYNCHPERSLS